MALWKDNTAPAARPNPMPPLPEAKEAEPGTTLAAEARGRVTQPAPTPAPVARADPARRARNR